MNCELVGVLVFVAVLMIYALKYLPKAITDLKKELGD